MTIYRLHASQEQIHSTERVEAVGRPQLAVLGAEVIEPFSSQVLPELS